MPKTLINGDRDASARWPMMAARTPPPEGFRTRDEVEVSSDEDGFRGSYFEARVVRSMPRLRCYTVEYDAIVDDFNHSRLLRETVEARHVRPRPPRLLAGLELALHRLVDAFYNDAWWIGVVSAVPRRRNGKYRVCFPTSREEMEFPADQIRDHLEWVDGRWVLPESLSMPKTPYDTSMLVEVASVKENTVLGWCSAVVVKKIWYSYFLVEYVEPKKTRKKLSREIVDLKHIKPCYSLPIDHPNEIGAFNGNGCCPEVKFIHQHEEKEHHTKLDREKERTMLSLQSEQVIHKSQDKLSTDIKEGQSVEVSTDEEGFSGVWFAATVLKLIGKTKLLVRYHNLRTDDGAEYLTEIVELPYIRPTPPTIPLLGNIKYLEEVDAFHNDGWWVGVVSKVLGCGRYMVYFRTWNEEIEYGQDELRLHQDFLDGRWQRPSQILL